MIEDMSCRFGYSKGYMIGVPLLEQLNISGMDMDETSFLINPTILFCSVF